MKVESRVMWFVWCKRQEVIESLQFYFVSEVSRSILQQQHQLSNESLNYFAATLTFRFDIYFLSKPLPLKMCLDESVVNATVIAVYNVNVQ